jgi:hypothetical protein
MAGIGGRIHTVVEDAFSVSQVAPQGVDRSFQEARQSSTTHESGCSRAVYFVHAVSLEADFDARFNDFAHISFAIEEAPAACSSVGQHGIGQLAFTMVSSIFSIHHSVRRHESSQFSTCPISVRDPPPGAPQWRIADLRQACNLPESLKELNGVRKRQQDLIPG